MVVAAAIDFLGLSSSRSVSQACRRSAARTIGACLRALLLPKTQTGRATPLCWNAWPDSFALSLCEFSCVRPPRGPHAGRILRPHALVEKLAQGAITTVQNNKEAML